MPSVRVLARARSLYGPEGTLILRKIVFRKVWLPRFSVIDDALIIKKSSARRSMVQLILIFQRYGI